MARTLKKLSLQYQYLKLELEDTEEQMDQFQKDWSTRFGKYFVQEKLEMWENTETGELRDSPPPKENKKPKIPKPKKLKEIYRKLSSKLHPDKGGSDEQFQKLKDTYDSNDFLGLISIASDNNIDFDIEEQDIELLQDSIIILEKKLKEKTVSMIWQYYTGSESAKKAVIQQIEIISGKKIDLKDLAD